MTLRSPMSASLHVASVTIDDISTDLLEEMQMWPPGKRLDDLEPLVESIKEHGLYQCLLVSRIRGENTMQLLSGVRRFAALCELRSRGFGIKFNVVCMPHPNRADAKHDCLLVNLQESQPRAVPDWIDMAERIDRILQEGKDYKYLAQVLGQTVPYVKSIHRLLQLPDEVQQMVKEKKLSLSHARVLQQRVPKEEIMERARQAQHWTLTALTEFLSSAYPE